MTLKRIFYWPDGQYSEEDSMYILNYKSGGNYMFIDVVEEMKDYDIQDCIFELLKETEEKPKGIRGGECANPNCRLNYNTFYQHQKDQLFYCYKCSLKLNQYVEICKYIKPELLMRKK